MKKLSTAELINTILLFGFGVFTMIRGIFWLREQESVINDSAFYAVLHHIMPIWIWGLIIIVTSLFLIAASWALPRRNYMAYALLFVGGLVNSIVYFFMTSASMFNAINWLSPAQFAILTAICCGLSFVGGAELYERYKG